eukprot:TRINITY_DN17775_c0_g1_i1.p1 TRINITY_DN17775_c0_g1~~TRINITY_DN17775_c0_g1_i1.p1  ORF type:complete len:332 (-),score=20.25 TRINITY_DN17775_c0_g1_i1:204-1133(-)
MVVGALRDIFEICTLPSAQIISTSCNCLGCEHHKTWSYPLPEVGPLGSREDTLRALAVCARLVYGVGFIDREEWGKLDPPLNGEGWRVDEYICEAAGFKGHVQAACYVRDDPGGCGAAIIAYRGTVSIKGVMQDIAIGMPVSAPAIKKAVKEASSFFQMCAHKHPDKILYVTGHSLGGFFAESIASYHNVDGACFNSPGPWSPNPAKNLTGIARPCFEVHLTRDDPLAFAFFPKPENSRHIGEPIWHPGKNHRVCQPYMKEISDMVGVMPVANFGMYRADFVDQMEALYPPDADICSVFSASEDITDTD